MTFERRFRGSNNTNKRDGPTLTQPKPEDFNPGKVAMDVRADALCHPATIYPLFGSIGLAVCAVAIPASLPVAAGLATLGLITSGASWYYNFVLKGEEKVAQRYASLREARRQYEKQELGLLTQACQKAGFEDGWNNAEKLEEAYQPLLDYFKEKLAARSNPVIEQFQLLAADAYKQGVSVLNKALDISKALEAFHINDLQKEIDLWKTDLSKAKPGSTKATTLEEQIAAHTETIDLFTARQEQQLQLLAQVTKIVSALRKTHLELVDLGNKDLNSFLSDDGGAATRLKSAVEAARRVEDRLKGINREDAETQEKYRQAARKHKQS